MHTKFFYLLFVLALLIVCDHPLEGSEKPKAKAIIFDFGGVIAKTDRQQIAEFVSKSLNISHEDAMNVLAGLKENSHNDGVENDYWLRYAKSRGKKLPDDWLKQLNEVRFNALYEIPGMVDVVKCLKKQGFQTALLSNVRKSQAQIKRKLGFYELFHPSVLSYEINIRKPDPKAYQYILNKLNLPPQEVIFIDNKAHNIEAAKALGMDAILFENSHQLIEALKTRNINVNSDLHCD